MSVAGPTLHPPLLRVARAFVPSLGTVSRVRYLVYHSSADAEAVRVGASPAPLGSKLVMPLGSSRWDRAGPKTAPRRVRIGYFIGQIEVSQEDDPPPLFAG